MGCGVSGRVGRVGGRWVELVRRKRPRTEWKGRLVSEEASELNARHRRRRERTESPRSERGPWGARATHWTASISSVRYRWIVGATVVATASRGREAIGSNRRR